MTDRTITALSNALRVMGINPASVIAAAGGEARVKVKPLVWEKTNNGVFCAPTVLGPFFCYPADLSGPHFCWAWRWGEGNAATLAEARAAAEAAWERAAMAKARKYLDLEAE